MLNSLRRAHQRLLLSLAGRVHDSIDQERRNRVLAGFLFFAFLLSGLMAIVRFSTEGAGAPSFAALTGSTIFLALLALYRIGVRPGLVSDITIGFTLFILIAITPKDGGLYSRALFWLPAVVLLSNFIGERMRGVACLLWAVVGLSLLLMLHQRGVISSQDAFPFGRVTACIGAMVIVQIIAASYEASRKLADAETERARQLAEDNARQKNEFLATMSHEFLTPMNGVIGMLQILMRTELEHRAKLQAERAYASANDMLNIIQNVLMFAQSEKERGPDQLLNIKEILNKEASQLRESCKSRNMLFSEEINVDSKILLRSEPTWIAKIIHELCSNALKFTHEGYIKLNAWLHRDEAGTTQLCVEVSDSGIGISEEDIGQIFEAFKQKDGSHTRSYGGLGLGLAIANKLCETLGGKIEVKSQEGVGSTFTVTVPLNTSLKER